MYVDLVDLDLAREQDSAGAAKGRKRDYEHVKQLFGNTYAYVRDRIPSISLSFIEDCGHRQE